MRNVVDARWVDGLPHCAYWTLKPGVAKLERSLTQTRRMMLESAEILSGDFLDPRDAACKNA